MRARVPRRRGVCARVGVLEDVLGAAGDQLGSVSNDPDATLGDLHEAVATLEETERTARRVLGGAHPVTKGLGGHLQNAQAAVRARESGAP